MAHDIMRGQKHGYKNVLSLKFTLWYIYVMYIIAALMPEFHSMHEKVTHLHD